MGKQHLWCVFPLPKYADQSAAEEDGSAFTVFMCPGGDDLLLDRALCRVRQKVIAPRAKIKYWLMR